MPHGYHAVGWMGDTKVWRRLDCVLCVRCTYDTQSARTCVVDWKTPSFSFCQVDMYDIGYRTRNFLRSTYMLPVDLRVKQLKLNQIPGYIDPNIVHGKAPLYLQSSFVAWNDLPGDIKSVRTKPMFKSKAKQFLFNKCLEQEENNFIVP